jgi:gamma-glutamyl-gamma-aminobutyrate hydrolase PuuD
MQSTPTVSFFVYANFSQQETFYHMVTALIGITSQKEHTDPRKPVVNASASYVEAILAAGGTPVIIPFSLDEPELTQFLPILDGVLFTGGPDINPAVYGGSMHPGVKGIDSQRDHSDIFIARYAIDRKIPFLAICRGIQIINVTLGGTIYTHISDQHPHAIFHTSYPDLPYNYLSHSVTISENSLLAQICRQESMLVNSLHHQGIKGLAPGLQAVARAPDQLVEAVQVPDHPFGLGVQWHPELLPDNPNALAIFRAFVEASGGSRS